jgi:hypothetical protein
MVRIEAASKKVPLAEGDVNVNSAGHGVLLALGVRTRSGRDS